MIIGLTGSFCSGKDTVGDYLQKKLGYVHISLSDQIREELRAKRKKITRTSLQDYANKKRAEEGYSYFAEKALGKLERNHNHIITSINVFVIAI